MDETSWQLPYSLSKKSMSSSAMPVCSAMFLKCVRLLAFRISSAAGNITSLMHREESASRNFRRHSCAQLGSSVQEAIPTTVSDHAWSE